jgi:hypothetical protein
VSQRLPDFLDAVNPRRKLKSALDEMRTVHDDP